MYKDTHEVDLSRCTQDVETCPVVALLFEYDEFASVTQGINPDAQVTREMIGNIFTACTRGTCPGQDPELAREIIQSLSNED